MTKDPVCGMTVDDNSPHRSKLESKIYVFCSNDCKARFDRAPATYLASAEPAVGPGVRS